VDADADAVEREIAAWETALRVALEQAIEHLQALIFDEGMDTLVTETGSPVAALRAGVLHYEQGVANLFAIVRASGSLPDAVAWSTLKASLRRDMLESGVDITLRTATETGLYLAEREPLGDHAVFRAWAGALVSSLATRAAAAPTFPAQGDDDARLYWAYHTLADLEDHAAFHAAVLAAAPPDSAVSAHAARLLALPRYDLILNASLLWLANAGARLTASG
jgi:hypothetical protein